MKEMLKKAQSRKTPFISITYAKNFLKVCFIIRQYPLGRNEVNTIQRCIDSVIENYYSFRFLTEASTNKTGTSKVGAISKAQKAQKFLKL